MDIGRGGKKKTEEGVAGGWWLVAGYQSCGANEGHHSRFTPSVFTSHQPPATVLGGGRMHHFGGAFLLDDADVVGFGRVVEDGETVAAL